MCPYRVAVLPAIFRGIDEIMAACGCLAQMRLQRYLLLLCGCFFCRLRVSCVCPAVLHRMCSGVGCLCFRQPLRPLRRLSRYKNLPMLAYDSGIDIPRIKPRSERTEVPHWKCVASLLAKQSRSQASVEVESSARCRCVPTVSAKCLKRSNAYCRLAATKDLGLYVS